MVSKRKYKRDLRRTILVVDDEQINREILGLITGDVYDVLFAENGQEALDIIRENSASLSLVLMDLMMPVMDGFTLLKTMRADKTISHIPVIVLTSEKSLEVESLKLGASDFISKPFNMPEVIMARIQRAIELSEDTHIIQVAERDNITKLYNMEFFYEYAHEIDRHHPDWDMDAIVVNINHFHLVNEIHGRGYGDKVLEAVGGKIRQLLEDIEGIAGRAEADNFYLYLRHQDNFEDRLHDMGDKVRNELEKTSIWLRMGIFDHKNDPEPLEKRFENALSACNTLRNKYNKYVAYYNRKLHEDEMLAEKLLSCMERALESEQFTICYQGKYSIQGGPPRLTSAEALVRWTHPEMGFLSPGIFIPLFEANGLIQKLDRYIFRHVAMQIRKWKDDLGWSVPVSVNVSRLDIFEKDLCDYFKSLLVEFSLEPSDLLLEITESAYAEDSDQLVATVDELRAAGFKIEMDDFGSGYSSLNMLAMLPIDVLKLDIRFLQNLGDSRKKLMMIKLMLDIAAHLEVPVVAEGIETEDQYIMLRDLGCDIIQGYYFARPIPPAEFEALMKENNNA